MLIFDTFFYLLLSQYISAINPGTFGSRKSPLFFIERFLYSPPKNGEVNHFQHSTEVQDTKYFEKPPTTLEVSISIERLYKNFGSIPAVKDVNLNVYKGEITALLGHNGAGKTTTMGILTGMMKPTAGFITYQNRLDILKCMQEFRRRLGLCPQENRLFPYLSAINHLIFFGMLKGASKSDATKEANEYLTMMEMTSKANSLSSSLSGGMKRKLSLSVALMGKVETLILDEPTSGMDVESRRKVWDLLLEMRGNRTIILTTHHMEEADALGDRVAIMNHGTIVCHGTTLFLKKAYGTGYEVTITRDTDNTVPITNLIRSVVPNADKQYESTFEVVYKLPLTDTAKFPELFYTLEEEKDSLAIVNISVSCTTMEQVFLKVGDVSVSDASKNSPSRRPTSTEINTYQYPLTRKTGLNLFLQQLAALFLKKFLFIKRNIIKLLSRVLLPTIIMMLLLFDASTIRQAEPPISVALSTYSRAKIMMTDTKTDQFNMFKRTVNYVENHKASILYSNTPNIVQGLLDYAAKSLDSFRKEMVFAASYNATHNLLLYNKFAFHSLAVVINSLSNIELEAVSKENSVRTVNHPIQAIRRSCDLSEVSSQLFLIFIALAFYSVDLSSYFSIFLSVERIDGFKHIQFMSNLSPFTYWLSNYIFDFVFFFVIVFLRILCFKLMDDRDGFLHFQHPFEVLLLLFCCFIASGLLFTYVMNFFSNSKEGSYAIFLIVNIVATILVCFFYYIEVMVVLYDGNIDAFQFPTLLYYFLKYLILLVPPLNYDLAFLKFMIAWSYNLNAKKPICQGKIKPQKYLVFSSKENFNGLLEEVIFLSIDIILYGILLWVIEAGYFGLLWNKLSSKILEKKFGQRNAGAVDPDVNHEQVIVRSQTHQLATRNRDTILLAQSLRKIYMKRRSPFVAVDDVNFAVKAGQCFGLLGVNGAGKSTCFKMLTGYILPTSGDSSIQNIWLSKSKSKYLSKAGYCAQTNCFIEELTGRETLTLVASLRGLSSNQLKSTVDKWLNILGLRSYQNQKCGGYSGGNKRKLCTAMSLIGDPNVVFLDEPTAGVDPVSRRKLYDVMEHSKSSGQAVVLTSHSMEECENLCDRLTIMTGGQMKCIGTAQHLKQRYARGFSILIKTNEIPDEDAALSNLKENMRLAFGEEFCNLKDEHKGLLYYQIKDIRLKWSQLFQTMETVKRDCEIVDDYTITDTSLEEVFMEFAQQAEIENHNRE